jgi:hypothetical protein
MDRTRISTIQKISLWDRRVVAQETIGLLVMLLEIRCKRRYLT